MMLYGRSPRKMAPDLLPQYADVDLSVEFYKQSGSGEWEAIKRTTGDLGVQQSCCWSGDLIQRQGHQIQRKQ